VKKRLIIVHGEDNRSSLVQSGVADSEIAIVPHGVFSFFDGNLTEPIAEENGTILFFGYIAPNKGLEYLLNACRVLRGRLPDLKLIVAGEGSTLVYDDLIANAGNVELHNHYVPNDAAANLFARASAVVLPYVQHQGHSGVLATAIGMGKPVVVSDVGNLPIIIRDGIDGLVVPTRDVNALAEAIVRVLCDQDLRLKIKDNLREKAKELSWDRIAQEHIRLYQRVVSQTPPSKNKIGFPAGMSAWRKT
jgi:glycosyltransferase involved in cell wall biosynthesis